MREKCRILAVQTRLQAGKPRGGQNRNFKKRNFTTKRNFKTGAPGQCAHGYRKLVAVQFTRRLVAGPFASLRATPARRPGGQIAVVVVRVRGRQRLPGGIRGQLLRPFLLRLAGLHDRIAGIHRQRDAGDEI